MPSDLNTGPAQFADHAHKRGVAQGLVELLASGSLEMSPNIVTDVHALAKLLPSGMRVYVNHPPRHSLTQSLPALKAIRAAGLEPVAHVAARRIASRGELTSFLERATAESGLSKVLLLGGDEPQPLGPYASGADLLPEGSFAKHGIREVGLPGYPEGHPRIPRAVIEEALAVKLAILGAQRLGAHIVTQFSFAPSRVVEYCSELARKVPAIPVYVGLAGPSDMRTLLRYARLCGVGASLRALQAQGMGAIRLFTHTDSREQVVAVANYCVSHRSCNVVGVHLFSFGGAAKTAEWINREITFSNGA